MQQNNLDTLKSDMEAYLKSNGFVVFYGAPRGLIERPVVDWDVERYPDFQEFLSVAQQLGVKMVVFHHREFASEVIDHALEELQDASFEFDDQRDVERRLRELRMYEGFTCALELSFDYQAMTYVFELRTEWYNELNDTLDELDMFPEEDDEDENPLSGYYSKN
ncbi:MAG TPA: hypothetical protein VER03_07780 [Bryobacteraceae bacterium]|nr:hypothetical protein [Bryobacteraceae bacterium]